MPEPEDQSQTFVIQSDGGPLRVLEAGYVLGDNYRLIELIGRGGMGCVFAAEHLILHKEVAVKVLAPEQISPDLWRRFDNEAKAIARLDHHNIVKIYDMGVDRGDCPFYVMDMLHGIPLDAVGDQVSTNELLEIFESIAAALAYAHKKGIIHRDIKPSNIMLVREPGGQCVPKILDFGVAKLVESSAAQSLTKTGELLGSPYYMSPEQIEGTACDARSDIYSLGCTIYKVFTDKVPFAGESAMQTFMMHANEPVPSIEQNAHLRAVPDGLDFLIKSMLAKQPEKRYQSMEQVAHALRRLQQGLPIGAERQRQSEADDGPAEVKTSGDSRLKTLLIGLVVVAVIGCVSTATFTLAPHKQAAQSKPKPVADFEKAVPTNFELDETSAIKAKDAQSVRLLESTREIKSEKFASGGKQFLRIAFPDLAVGEITAFPTTTVAAKGLTTVPDADQMGFFISAANNPSSFYHPQFLRLLDKNIFTAVGIGGPAAEQMLTVQKPVDPKKTVDAFSNIMQATSDWPRVKFLNIHHFAVVGDDFVANMSRFKHLEQISFKAVTQFPDDGMSRLKIYDKIVSFSMLGGTRGWKTIIAAVREGHIQKVEMSGLDLNKQTAPVLAGAPELKHLVLTGTATYNVELLKVVARNKNLQELEILDSNIPLVSLRQLRAVHTRLKMVISRDSYKDSEEASLQQMGITLK